jgi:rRNA maturation endonuclease Nob1
MNAPVCPKCGEYWNGEFCELCGHAHEDFRKRQVKRKFKQKTETEEEKGKGNGRP